ncbi:hypothetical protein UT300012_21940 [Paraclostridium bifermentans]
MSTEKMSLFKNTNIEKEISMDSFGLLDNYVSEAPKENPSPGRAPKEKPNMADKDSMGFKMAIEHAVEAIARARYNNHKTINAVYSQILALALSENSEENIEKLTYLSALINPGNYLLTEMWNEDLFIFDMEPDENVEKLVREYENTNVIIECDQEVTKECIHEFLHKYYDDADDLLSDAYKIKTFFYKKYKSELTKNLKSFSTREDNFYPDIFSKW